MIKTEITKEFDCKIDLVYGIVCDYAKYCEWRKDLSSVENVGDNTFIECDNSGFKTEFRITNKIENSILEFDIKNDNLSGHWIGKFENVEAGIRITFTELIYFKNFIMKIFAKKYLSIQQKKFLFDLEQRITAMKAKTS